MSKNFKRKSKTVNDLEKKAGSGDLLAKFRLFQLFDSGQFVDEDKEIAEDYLNDVISESHLLNLRYDKFQLFNFKRFSDLNFKFSRSNLTVIIGNNGAGKTSILEAVSKSLSWFSNNIIKENRNGQMININDICMKDNSDYSLITSLINYTSNNKFDMQLSRPKNANEQGGQYQGSYESVKLLADMYRYLNKRVDNFNLPLVAYYPIERTQNPSLIQKNKIDTFASKSSWSSIDGYDNSLTSVQNFNNFLGWYKKLSNANLSIDKKSEDLKLLITQHKDELSSSFIQKIELESEGNKDVSEFLLKFKSEKNSQIDILQQQLKSQQSPIKKKLEFINLAITKFIPEFKNIEYENHPDEGLFVTKNGLKLNVHQLSQGERTLMALIGDISRRLILLNPSLENPLHGTGIVLIDEIELHLHPSWQQKVLTKLINTFPNIQFLVTTHSPQVLTTCKKGEIRLLRANGKIETPIWDVYGRESGDALSELMDTEPRPPLDYVLLIEEYLKLIDLNEHDSIKGKSLRNDLNLSLGSDHHELLKADRKIKRKELLK